MNLNFLKLNYHRKYRSLGRGRLFSGADPVLDWKIVFAIFGCVNASVIIFGLINYVELSRDGVVLEDLGEITRDIFVDVDSIKKAHTVFLQERASYEAVLGSTEALIDPSLK